MGLLENLRDVAQGASNSVAGNLSAPVDGINWLLKKAGMGSEMPVGGSDWLAKQGFTAEPQSRGYGLLGEALGGVTPMLAAAKAPQIAAGMAKAGEGMAAGGTALVDHGMEMANAKLGKYMDDTGLKQNIYLPHTPSKPNASVGDRFEREFVGQMAEKTPRRIEDLQGGSLVAMPWDSTSRGYMINSISGERLPSGLLSTGGQDFARDLAHVRDNVGGASGFDIAKRVQARVQTAAKDNERLGGNGNVFSMPNTMGEESANYSTMPTEALLGLMQRADLSKASIAEVNQYIKNATVIKNKKAFRAFTGFKGVDTDEGLLQFITGQGLDAPAGELRKAFSTEMTKVRSQRLLNYNKEDLVNAINDPALRGVEKGYMGNTIIKSDPRGLLTHSDHPAYDTNFPGQYYGSLLDSLPIEVLMPKTYGRIFAEQAPKGGHIRNNTIGAMEKRKAGFSEIVDQQVVDSVGNYLRTKSGR